MDRRSHSANPLIIVDGDGTVAPAGRDWASPDGSFEVPAGNALGLAPGVYTRVAGATGQTAADYRPFVRSTDGFNPAPFHYLQTPSERTSLWLLGSNPLSESVNFFMEALVHQRESAQQASPSHALHWHSGRQLLQPIRGRGPNCGAPLCRGRQPRGQRGRRSMACAHRVRRRRRSLAMGAGGRTMPGPKRRVLRRAFSGCRAWLQAVGSIWPG